MFTRRLVAACLTIGLAAPVLAANLAAPKGPVLLTVTGYIGHSNEGGAAQFDRDMLESLDWRDIETFTHYTDGLQTFQGPTLASLLKAVGVTDGSLRAVALDDYAVDIPVSDLARHDILLALEHNGKPMRIRDRGPIWVIYPAKSEAEIADRHKSHSIWQLISIDVTR